MQNWENPKRRIRRKLVWNFSDFGHLNLFRISDFVLRAFPLGHLNLFRSAGPLSDFDIGI